MSRIEKKVRVESIEFTDEDGDILQVKPNTFWECGWECGLDFKMISENLDTAMLEVYQVVALREFLDLWLSEQQGEEG